MIELWRALRQRLTTDVVTTVAENQLKRRQVLAATNYRTGIHVPVAAA